jgi:integrase
MARAYGSGSKRERRPGVWELRANGASKTFHGGAREAERELRTLIDRTGRAQVSADSTLGELLDAWLPDAVLAKRTRDSYANVLRLHLAADHRLRATRVHELQLRDFDRLYLELGRAGVGAQTVRKLHTALSSALTEAVRWNWIVHNPAHRARLPEIPPSVGTAPRDADLQSILAVVDTRRDLQCQVWINLALATGKRPGEVLALRWSRVDLRKASITVEFGTDIDHTLKATKTNKVRVVAIDADLVALLKRWRTAQLERSMAAGMSLAADPYVLSNDPDSSGPWKARAASKRFQRLCKAANVTGVRLYDLRHAHATALLEAGVHVNVVADRIGNDPAVTLRVYGHARAGADQAAAELAGSARRRLHGSSPASA